MMMPTMMTTMMMMMMMMTQLGVQLDQFHEDEGGDDDENLIKIVRMDVRP